VALSLHPSEYAAALDLQEPSDHTTVNLCWSRFEFFIRICHAVTDLGDHGSAGQSIRAHELPEHPQDGLVGLEPARMKEIPEAGAQDAFVQRQDGK
jgi:hypothetical protein